ncbi:hypothetical protein [Nocardia sp. NPDC004711]
MLTGASTPRPRRRRPGSLGQLRELFDTISVVRADGAYVGALVDRAKSVRALTIQIVERSDDITGFVRAQSISGVVTDDAPRISLRRPGGVRAAIDQS